MSSVFKNFLAKFSRISQPAHEPAPRRKLPFAPQAALRAIWRYPAGLPKPPEPFHGRHCPLPLPACGHPRCTASGLRKIKNGYCSRLCLSRMQIQVLKYLRKPRAKRAQNGGQSYAERRVSIHLFRRFPKYPFRNDRRDSSRRQYRAIRRQPPPSGKQKPPITTRCLCRTRCQIPALSSQSVRARNTRNPLRIKAMPQPACNLR